MTIASKFALAAACALAVGLPAAAAPASEPGDMPGCFLTRDIRNHTVGDDRTMFIDVGGRSVYRIAMSNNCLAGSTSTDPDNDTLTYAWTQTSGPNVTLNGANTASMSFTAPDNSGNIGIQLTVTDSKGASATATTTIAINKKSGCSSSGGSPAPLLALLALGLLARVRRRTA